MNAGTELGRGYHQLAALKPLAESCSVAGVVVAGMQLDFPAAEPSPPFLPSGCSLALSKPLMLSFRCFGGVFPACKVLSADI